MTPNGRSGSEAKRGDKTPLQGEDQHQMYARVKVTSLMPHFGSLNRLKPFLCQSKGIFLIGLAGEAKGTAASLLRRCDLSIRALRQQGRQEWSTKEHSKMDAET